MLYSGNYLMFVRDHDQLAKLMERCEREVKLYEQDIGKLSSSLSSSIDYDDSSRQ